MKRRRQNIINKIRVGLAASLVSGLFVVITLHRIAISMNGGDDVTWDMVFTKGNILITGLFVIAAFSIAYTWKGSTGDDNN